MSIVMQVKDAVAEDVTRVHQELTEAFRGLEWGWTINYVGEEISGCVFFHGYQLGSFTPRYMITWRSDRVPFVAERRLSGFSTHTGHGTTAVEAMKQVATQVQAELQREIKAISIRTTRRKKEDGDA